MPSSAGIVAVAFDLDGLMFNTEDLYDEVSHQVLNRRGHQFGNELKLKMMGLPGPKAIEAMRDHCGLSESVDTLLGEVHDGMFAILTSRLTPMPGLLSLLDLLQSKNIPLSIATSSSRKFLDHVLLISGLTQRFKFTLTAEDVEKGKPHPDIYLESAKLHGVLPENMLVLEDSWIGTQSAAAAGTFAVAVPGQHSIHQDFSHVEFVAKSLSDSQITGLF